ncbi:MAG: transporter substrate-binding domain-containing protein [Desulfotignum sp.]|nr:transporter substrate-binding domain-containing protein [Desulfotignum sp.]MCF8137300.1 transporter substrate-binding domain-containing protein [Desulfotignum sp.]
MTEKNPIKTVYCILWIAAALIGVGCFTPYAHPVFAGDADTAARQTIRSGAEVDYPPFSFVDEHGKANGFSVELMRAALAVMGRDVTFRTGPWTDVRTWLEHAEIDALPLVGRTPEREALFDFTVPYMSLHGAIVVRGNETGIRDLADLRGRKVAVMTGDNAEEFLRREDRGIDIHTRPTFDIALQELSDGRYDAVVAQRLVALRLIQKAGLTDLHVIERPIEGFEQDFCFAVHDGDRDTLALLNEGLAIVMADGTYRHLHSKWFAAMQLPSDRPIVVGGDRNFPPYEFLDENGQPAGYNVDLTRAIASEMGLNIDIRLGRWTERIEALENGRIDVMQGMFYSPDRDLTFDFSQPHAVSHYVAVVRTGEGPAPESVQDLSGKRIVVEQGDILHDFVITNDLDNQAVAVADQETALRELREGRHDCALVSLITALYLTNKHGWSDVVIGKQTIFAAEYCYASAKGQKALLAQFSEGLKALDNTGEYRRIHDKWLRVYQDTPTSLTDALRYSAIVIIPLLVIILLAVTWSWLLRRQVAEKTNALQESLDRFKYVFEAANVGKSITLPTGEVNANKAYADFLGYAPEELEGKKWQDLTPAQDIEKIDRIIRPLLTGEKRADRFEKRYVHKNGTLLWADVSVAIWRDDKGTPLYFMTTIVDITERKKVEADHDKLQSQLLQAQKMESVGRLAGGVAHDYNNMLGVIMGYAQLAIDKTDPEDPLRADLKEIVTAAERSTDITRQLLAFARKQTIDPKVLDLNEAVEGMLKMIRRLIGEDIDLSWKPKPGVWPVKIDPSQLNQILVNLCVNARDAIADVGKITIETDTVRFDDAYCADHAGFIPGEYVLLAVSDDGRGMDRKTLDNIFEPFYSTKAIGKGTGLGLSVIYGIVKQNEGFINVYSEPGKGSTFRLYFTRHADDVSPIETVAPEETPVGSGETVLVVEDETSILKLAKRILEQLNYTVLTAETPGEAIAVTNENDGDIHLLITDVVMPEMNGRDLAEKLLAEYPKLKVLFMSGYTANVIAHHGVLDADVHFIQKPFSNKDLAVKVRKALER